ncbi:3-hydroxyacyl-CoA dehydrogenase [Plasticicumulans lactativorans]|uniref:3-hydroxyacyl-CoA dehydrogenase n=1 Tax=Plasticicumulans lactativorans TaxID=1133106 RepID=A0A4R2L9B1_9GAMM|nr:3-hydroxybutyryl-CoA dehydrogenase [Plasticicumulans lactativorans]TCO80839.1 3-hydroxyacyl-CoA dehydrogenase [Plasticicumulans lactativorans]
MQISRIGVVGAGQMGNGIAQVCAMAGYAVVMRDVAEAALARGLATIEQSLARLAAKGRLSHEEQAAARARIETSTALAALADCDVIIEAATENEALKLAIFRELDAVAKPGAILASNTSSISITRIAGATGRADHVIGMHFMNPVPVMQLVEIIRALQTADAVYAATEALARALGKTPVEVRDAFGFVSNRVLMPMINEAVFCLYEGVGTPEAIDTVMKLGMNHPMGPLALADLIGLDTCLSIMEVLHTGFADSKYRPCPLLRQMVDAGWLGRKSGRGFYVYGS